VTRGARHRSRSRYLAKKVPEITAYFWVVKVLTTALGESTSDWLVHTIDPVAAVLLGFVGFVLALALQFAARRYVAPVYWLAVTMVAVFGTMCADVLHIKFHVAYAASTILFAVITAVLFIVWYRTERTLSIHSIVTVRREVFYWLTVSATFAMGTAVGDLTATTFHLGYFGSAVLFACLIALPGLAYRYLDLNAVLAFWIAYTLTRPLGASIADWLGKPKIVGGLGIGDGPVALVLALLIVGFVAYLAVSRVDVDDSDVSRS
jgi:uncharacterized membrane-anchored protein